jgi:hypothetical protein
VWDSAFPSSEDPWEVICVRLSVSKRKKNYEKKKESQLSLSLTTTMVLGYLVGHHFVLKSLPNYPLGLVWIIGIEFHSNNSNLGIYQLR